MKQNKEDITEIPTIKSKRADGKEVSYRIKELENGFLISQDVSWKDEKEGYQREDKEYFVKTNPIAEESNNMYQIIEAALENQEV